MMRQSGGVPGCSRWRWPADRAGQHTAEFVIVIGLATSVAIGMLYLLRKSVMTGIGSTTDTILGPPRKPATNTQTALRVESHSDTTDSGAVADSSVSATANDLVQGVSRNEDIRIRVIPEPKPR